jgi:hypothetical protein
MSLDVQSAPATLRVLQGLQAGVSERRRLQAVELSEQERAEAQKLANATLRLARSDRARSVLSACLARVSSRPADRFAEAADLVLDRASGVLDGRIDPHEDPLFNPSVCLLADEHDEADVRALSCAYDFATTRRLPECVIERFFELEWIDANEQDARWVGVRLCIGEAGQYDFGDALAVVNLHTSEVHWLDPDSSIV